MANMHIEVQYLIGLRWRHYHLICLRIDCMGNFTFDIIS